MRGRFSYNRGMPLTAPVLHLSAKDREEIDRWLDAYGTPQQVALRSRIVLAADEGQSDSAVARDLEINRKTVIFVASTLCPRRD
jgi:hypothetical protein